MRWPIVRFVESAQPGSRILFDCNASTGPRLSDVTTGTGAGGLSLGSPTLSGSPGATGRVYGGRTISIPLEVRGPRSLADAALSDLARAIVREQVWLEVQMSANTDSYWFRCYPGEQALDFTGVLDDEGRPSIWRCNLSIPAAPFGLGETVTQATQTVSSNPATGGCTLELEPIKGDAPVPLSIRVKPVGTRWSGGWRIMWTSVSSLPGAPSAPVWLDPAVLTPGSGSGPLTADAAWPGGGYRDLTPSTVGASVAADIVNADLPAGRYLVLCRVGAQVGDPGFVTFDVTIHSQAWLPRARTTFTTQFLRGWVLAGEVANPRNVDIDAMDGETATAMREALYAQLITTSGSVQPRFGGLLLIPIDGPGIVASHTLSSKPGQILTNEAARWDGETQSIVRYNSAGRVYSLTSPEPAGSWPMAHPGLDNRLDMVPNVGSTPTETDTITAQTQVTVSYRPRYLWFPSPAVEAK